MSREVRQRGFVSAIPRLVTIQFKNQFIIIVIISGDVSRNEFPNLMKSSMSSTDTYSTFNAIKWRNKIWRKGDIILTRKTKPVGLLGRIHRFLVPKCEADLSGNYYGATALAQIHLIPEEVFGSGEEASKLIFFYQINIETTDEIINSELKKIYERLPKQIEVTFPREYPLVEGLRVVSGTPIGDIKVIVKNSSGERLKSDRIPYKSGLKIIKMQTEIWKIEGFIPFSDFKSIQLSIF